MKAISEDNQNGEKFSLRLDSMEILESGAKMTNME
jgi:hypothetical protein